MEIASLNNREIKTLNKNLKETVKELTEADLVKKEQERPLILRDISLAKRDSWLKKAWIQLWKLKNLPQFSSKAKLATAVIILLLIFAFIAGSKLIFINRNSKEVKLIINKVEDDLKLAQIYIAQNNAKDARKLVSTSLLSLSSLEIKDNEKTSAIKQTLQVILDKIDLTRTQTPEMIFDYSPFYNEEAKINFITNIGKNTPYGFLTDGGVVELKNEGPNLVQKIEGVKSANVFYENGKAILFNGSDILISFDSESQKTFQYQLENPISAIDSKMYEQNLYITDGVNIYKYSGVTEGKTARASWLNDILSDAKLMAVDGNIYILSDSGILYTYFKGKKEKEVQLSITPAAKSALLTSKDVSYLVYIDAIFKKIMLFDKNTGNLNGTYKADNLNDIKHWSLNGNELYLLSADQKIWKLNLE